MSSSLNHMGAPIGPRAALQRDARAGSPSEGRAREAFRGLLAAEGAMLRAYFRLDRAAQPLFDRARRAAPRARGGAARQLELERKRLGRELHTGVGQALAAIRLQLEVLQSQIPNPEPPVAHAMGRISAIAEAALAEVRSVSNRLHPPEWRRLTLEEALRDLWRISGVAERLQADLHIEIPATEPDPEVKVLIYRSMQEALSNLIQHSRATRVEVHLALHGSTLRLTVRDNGVGFDAARLGLRRAGSETGIGLRSLRDQAAEVGGCLRVESGSFGTKLEVAAPLGSRSAD